MTRQVCEEVHSEVECRNMANQEYKHRPMDWEMFQDIMVTSVSLVTELMAMWTTSRSISRISLISSYPQT